jgi:hypothetical protein
MWMQRPDGTLYEISVGKGKSFLPFLCMQERMRAGDRAVYVTTELASVQREARMPMLATFGNCYGLRKESK